METHGRWANLIKGLVILILLATLSLAWRFTSMSEWINFDTVMAWQESMKGHPAALAWVVGIYMLGSLVLFPVTILNLATIFTFGPILGNAYSLAGWLSSASMGYGIGRAIGRDFLLRIAGPRLDRFLRRTERHGLAAVLTVRLLPVAPFSIVNLFVGVSSIRFRDFFLGSAVGRIPGILLLALVGVQFENFLRDPGAGNVVLLGLVVFLLPLGAAWLYKRLRARSEIPRDASEL